MIRCFAPFSASLLSLVVFISPIALAAPSLSTYNIDAEQISVSGLSSGGYMAVQMHVAFSTSIMGVGVLAAGPYLCAEGSVLAATSQCPSNELSYLPPASHFRELTLEVAAAERIDPTSGIAGDRVWLFWGGADDVVLARVVDRLKEYYASFTDPAGIAFLRGAIPGAQHAMITEDHGSACGFKGDSYINDCDFDAAGKLLQHIYGDLEAPVGAPESTGRVYTQIGWWFWTYYHASGSGDYLGFLGSTSTTLQETLPGYLDASSCP